jgi:hypothetical protein
VPGKGDDGLQPLPPGRHAAPAPVSRGELTGRGGGDYRGKWVVRRHSADGTDPDDLRPGRRARFPALCCDSGNARHTRGPAIIPESRS